MRFLKIQKSYCPLFSTRQYQHRTYLRFSFFLVWNFQSTPWFHTRLSLCTRTCTDFSWRWSSLPWFIRFWRVGIQQLMLTRYCMPFGTFPFFTPFSCWLKMSYLMPDWKMSCCCCKRGTYWRFHKFPPKIALFILIMFISSSLCISFSWNSLLPVLPLP